MTCQRFLYKLFWRRLGVPLILGCGVIAMVTTFYHHTLYKLVDAPPNSQKEHQKKTLDLKGEDLQYAGSNNGKAGSYVHPIIKPKNYVNLPGKEGSYLNPKGEVVKYLGPQILEDESNQRYQQRLKEIGGYNIRPGDVNKNNGDPKERIVENKHTNLLHNKVQVMVKPDSKNMNKMSSKAKFSIKGDRHVGGDGNLENSYKIKRNDQMRMNSDNAMKKNSQGLKQIYKHNKETIPKIKSQSANYLVYNQSALNQNRRVNMNRNRNYWDRNYQMNNQKNRTYIGNLPFTKKDPFIRKKYTIMPLYKESSNFMKKNQTRRFWENGNIFARAKTYADNQKKNNISDNENINIKKAVVQTNNKLPVIENYHKPVKTLNQTYYGQNNSSNARNRWKYKVNDKVKVVNLKPDPKYLQNSVFKRPVHLDRVVLKQDDNNKSSIQEKDAQDFRGKNSRENKLIFRGKKYRQYRDSVVVPGNEGKSNQNINKKLEQDGIRRPIAKVQFGDSDVDVLRKQQDNEIHNDLGDTDSSRQRRISDRKRTPGWPIEFEDWSQSKAGFCDGRFEGYYNEFVLLKDVIVDRHYFTGKAGGEDVMDVLNQPEEDEYYKYEMGCFQLPCETRPDYYFNAGYFPSDYLFNMKTHDISEDVDDIQNDFTIALTRYEYVNMYHTMTDWYNAFLLMKFFNKTKTETRILIIDSHPKGSLDDGWSNLFSSYKRLSQLKPRTRFKQMAWNMLGYESPILNHFIDSIPLLDEFRKHFLSSFNVEQKRSLDCKNVRILFIWRKDYLAHPRNPSGKLSRKIKNEKELLKSVKRKYSEFNIEGVQIDLFNLHQQLHMIANTDILIGMHGAGLTHALFLPDHAALIELVPNYWTSAMDHFMSIASWRGILYERWVNSDPHNEVPDDSTRVPPEIINVLVKSVLRKMKCISSIQEGFYNAQQ